MLEADQDRNPPKAAWRFFLADAAGFANARTW
jgi:hypothetical protein